MHIRVGIIGMGWVGSSVAMSVLRSGIANELLLCDVNRSLAEGEALDLAHGGSFYPTAAVRAAEIEELLSADAIVIAAGRGGRPGETRLQLLQENAEIAYSLGERLRGYPGMVIVVSNPVDVLTAIVVEASGLPSSRVIGTGTMLDTARLRQMLGARLKLDPRAIDINIVGEHGDSQVVLWQSARIGGRALRDWKTWDRTLEPEIAATVRGAAGEIIKRKGATNHAIGLVSAALLRWVLRGERRVLCVSHLQNGAFGIEGVALSLPTVVGELGAEEVIEPDISTEEKEALIASAEILRSARAGSGR